ncbi:JHY protein, partial [Upupa epops]|nr:JHY protein [Upupa epops]
SSKNYVTLDLKLGGLGPDYEAVKKKQERLKQQKEYSKQIKEHNMKNISSVPTLPVIPQLPPPGSRQKALEYAKMISRPKTFMGRQPNGEMKGKVFLLKVLNEERLPPIKPLKNLQSRHKEEKKIGDAFRLFHI